MKLINNRGVELPLSFPFDLQQSAYGEGVDGVASFTGSNVPAGSLKTGTNEWTLQRSVFYSSMTVDGGKFLNTNGFCIFCTGTATINGTLNANGANGGAPVGYSTAGAGGARIIGAVLNSLPGGAGATSAVDGVAGSGNYGVGGNGGNGGSGGYLVTPGKSPGPSINATRTSVSKPIQVFTPSCASQAVPLQGLIPPIFPGCFLSAGGAGGSGGGSGGGSYAGLGGGGGAGGGCITLVASTIAGTGSANANGGSGGVGGAGGVMNSHGGGGGGGGGGGWIYLVYSAYSLTGLSVIGGSAGAGGASGGGTGVAGLTGGGGSSGRITKYNRTLGGFE